MNCEKYSNLIDDLIEGELDENTVGEVSLHIFDCPNCTSQFGILKREKEMYSHYLFDIEPPPYLHSKFEAQLRAEEKANYQGIFVFLRFNPILMTAVVLILFAIGFALLNLKTEKQPIEEAKDVQPNLKSSELNEFSTGGKVIVAATPKKVEKLIRTRSGSDLANDNFYHPKVDKPIEIKQTETIKKPEPKPKTLPQMPKVDSEELARFKQIQTFELETAKQMEKIELLLRSFRNADFIEGSEIYDISYEQQQARKLLQTNVALRQRAESYGTIFAEEMLSKVEPYLLDIANLDIDATSEQVLEIKDRVRSQNIIASLQGF